MKPARALSAITLRVRAGVSAGAVLRFGVGGAALVLLLGAFAPRSPLLSRGTEWAPFSAPALGLPVILPVILFVHVKPIPSSPDPLRSLRPEPAMPKLLGRATHAR